MTVKQPAAAFHGTATRRSARRTALTGPPPRENRATGILATRPTADFHPCPAVVCGAAGRMAARRFPDSGRGVLVFFGPVTTGLQPAAGPDFNRLQPRAANPADGPNLTKV